MTPKTLMQCQLNHISPPKSNVHYSVCYSTGKSLRLEESLNFSSSVIYSVACIQGRLVNAEHIGSTDIRPIVKKPIQYWKYRKFVE